MDMHGAVKFPARYMGEILKRAEKLLDAEAETARMFREPGFTLEKWKASVGRT